MTHGKIELKRVKVEAERLFQLSQEAYVRSSLPSEPDRDRAERLCVELSAGYHQLSLSGSNAGYSLRGPSR